MLGSMTDTFGGVDEESEDEVAESWCTRSVVSRMSLVAPSLSSATSSWSRPRSSIASSLQTGTQKPSTAVPHPLLAPLHTFISPIDPSTRFTDLVEIAEGESGSVYAARIPKESSSPAPPLGTERPIPAGISHVAIKRIVLPPASSTGEGSTTANPTVSAGAGESSLSIKIASLLHELTLLKNLEHEHILLLDGVYVHTNADVNEGENNSGEYPSANTAVALDTSLWIRMELMERSLADVIALVAEGLALQERMVGRFTSDVLLGLDYLQKQHIAHRDVRSDNLLLNVAGVVKIADFSNAIRVAENAPMVTGAVGVIYWQAPEMRTGPYDALKVDVWSVGATVWELVETVPPFSIPASPSSQTTFLPPNSIHLGSQWPPLSHPGHYSKGFHEFLRLCGMDAAARPCPEELLNTQFIRNACGRAVIRQLLTQCRSMEEALVAQAAQAAQEDAVSVES
ncbi:kinase-like domain-containing protein [Pisolithus croceorrhizus]|nr:kinase-like domain-containing protein [Pisolithus croceorrhizus]